MKYCLWFWHGVKDNLTDKEVSNIQGTAVYARYDGMICMYIGKAPCRKCGTILNVSRVGWFGFNSKLGPWEIADQIHLDIFFEFKKIYSKK